MGHPVLGWGSDVGSLDASLKVVAEVVRPQEVEELEHPNADRLFGDEDETQGHRHSPFAGAYLPARVARAWSKVRSAWRWSPGGPRSDSSLGGSL